jgi:hypothetical protein
MIQLVCWKKGCFEKDLTGVMEEELEIQYRLLFPPQTE